MEGNAPSRAFTTNRYWVSGDRPVNVTVWAVPTAALNASVHGHAVPATYDTQPVAGSFVVNVIVTADDVRFDVAIFVISGAVVSGASGPPAAHAVPANNVAG